MTRNTNDEDQRYKAVLELDDADQFNNNSKNFTDDRCLKGRQMRFEIDLDVDDRKEPCYNFKANAQDKRSSAIQI